MKRINFILALFAILSFHAQTISGTVISKDDNHPIPYAKIGIINSNYGIQADENGKFQIKLDDISKDKELIVAVAGWLQTIPKLCRRLCEDQSSQHLSV